jgi:hypothetical protein
MSLRVVSRAARVFGFVVSPLLTAPAAAGDLERGVLAATLRGEGPAALHVVDLAHRAAGTGHGERRLRF